MRISAMNRADDKEISAFALIVACGDIFANSFYVFGPDRWTSVSNFDVLRLFPLPIRVWAALLILAGVLIIVVSSHWAGYWLGAAILTIWSVSSAATLFTTASAGGGPAWFACLAALHYLGLWVRARNRPSAEEGTR